MAVARAMAVAARARVVAMRAVAKEVRVMVAGADAEVTGRVNREREEAEATGRGSMVTGAVVMATVAGVRVRAAVARAEATSEVGVEPAVLPLRSSQHTDHRRRSSDRRKWRSCT